VLTVPGAARTTKSWAAWVGGIVAALAVLYLSAMNLFLRTRMFRNLISSDPDSVLVEYTEAYSLLPGKIHVEGLAIRGRDHHVEWILRLERCDFWVSLLDLAHRKFHARHVRGDGLALRIRLRVGKAVPEHDAALPPVPGFTDPPYKDSGPLPPPLSDADYNLWAVQLDDVDANQVRELWIDTIRYSGDLRVRGRWLFRPSRWLDIGPAIVDARTLDVSYGMRPLASDLKGAIEATVHPFDVRVPDGLEMLDYVSANIRLRGHLDGAAVLGTFLLSDEVEFEHGEGPIDVLLEVDHGVLARGTHIEVRAPGSAVRVMGLSFDGAALATLDVQGGLGDKATATVMNQVTDLRVSNHDGATAGAASVTATLASRELALSHGFADVAFTADVRGAETPSLQHWASTSKEVDIQSGVARAEGHLEGSLAEKSGRGELTFEVQNLSVRGGPDRVSGSVEGKISMDHWSLPERAVSLGNSRIRLRDAFARVDGVELGARALEASGHLGVSLSDERVRGAATFETEELSAHTMPVGVATGLLAHLSGQYRWGAGHLELAESDVVLRDLVLRATRGEGPPSFSAPSVRVRTSGMLAGQNGLEGSVDVELPHAEVRDMAALQSVLPVPRDVEIQQGRATISARLGMELPSLVTTGSAEVTASSLRVRIASRTIAGDLSMVLRAQGRGNSTDLSGSLLAFDSAAAEPPADPWWARVELTESELRASAGLGFRAKLHATAKDASPVSAMLATRTFVPAWILGVMPMNGLDVTCELRTGASWLEVRSLVAHGGMDLVQLEYSRRHEAAEWALLLQASVIQAGFYSGASGTQFVLFGVRPWFEQKVQALKTRESDEW
jgi:hypothetical protein